MNRNIRKNNGINYMKKSDIGAEHLIPRSLFSGYFGPPPDRRVDLFLTDLTRVSNGTFGVVYRANLFVYQRSNTTNQTGYVTTVPQQPQIVAVKRVLQDVRFKNRELDIMRQLNHQNIITLKFFFKVMMDDNLHLGLIMEFLPMTFVHITRQNSPNLPELSESQLKSYSLQLMSAMVYIHSLGIVHRDIKPQNILVDITKMILKVGDFGSAKKLTPTENNVAYICSRHYRAPELILGNTSYGLNIDVWSCGCVLAEAIIGTFLFPGQTSSDQLAQILNIIGSPPSSIIQRIAPNVDYSMFERIVPKTLKKVLNCKYSGFVELIEAMLIFDPIKRPSSLDILASSYLAHS